MKAKRTRRELAGQKGDCAVRQSHTGCKGRINTNDSKARGNADRLILPIDAKYRIAADRYSWTIEQYKPRQRAGKQWAPILWYSTLEGAVNGLAHLRLRTCGAHSLCEALNELERVTATLSAALHPRFAVERQP
jgi:hypothetical protein